MKLNRDAPVSLKDCKDLFERMRMNTEAALSADEEIERLQGGSYVLSKASYFNDWLKLIKFDESKGGASYEEIRQFMIRIKYTEYTEFELVDDLHCVYAYCIYTEHAPVYSKSRLKSKRIKQVS